ncbi:aminotransferase class V-fold PLP-dependent enzyme [Aeoliella sp. SH292]|uniref:aminotransferase class V-fold PLP-dependent enzyme n=1 Tax=Aeoliella sp. SH292 TaxID=3454464 RepID=UPI003F955EF7
MGRISPTARAIQTDYLRFAGEHGCPPAISDLLVHGGRDWSAALKRRFPFLAGWRGVRSLKRRIRQVVGAPRDSAVMLTSRTHALMELAAYLVLRNCDTVLTVDLAWPAYREVLQNVASQLGRNLVTVNLRALVLQGASVETVVCSVVEAFHKSHASGLFLPAVSHDGVQLPIDKITTGLKASSDLRFVLVDGAQHLAHGDLDLADMDCDFYLAGTHKWLRSLYPLGVAAYGHPRSRSMIKTVINELLTAGIVDDPLLRFTSQLENAALSGPTETINLSGLLSAHGAAVDASPSRLRGKALSVQLMNGEKVGLLAERAGWQRILPVQSMRSGILLLRPPGEYGSSHEDLRKTLESRGVVATTYDDALVRFSMPRRRLTESALGTIRDAL